MAGQLDAISSLVKELWHIEEAGVYLLEQSYAFIRSHIIDALQTRAFRDHTASSACQPFFSTKMK